MKKPTILIVDDDADVRTALQFLLNSHGHSVVSEVNPTNALRSIKDETIELILLDLNYTNDTTSGEEGLSLIKKIRDFDEQIPIIVMTGWGTVDLAVTAMKSGANDFIQKPWENTRLLSIITSQLKLAETTSINAKLMRQNQLLQNEIKGFKDIIAQSTSMQSVLDMVHRVAKTDASILFTGENGTGKSLFARYVHEKSTRKNADLVSVNMGAVTESLFESEMFGHVKGAFTDAKSSRIGRFELADQGTLFLDEIANTPYSQQGKLLRVLEENQFEKVGSSKTQAVNVRMITATNANLFELVNSGRFRKDLLYRINTVEIEIPPLRKRKEDILPLANDFLKGVARKYSQESATISESAQQVLLMYSWPGNVRELGHVIERAFILCQDNCIRSSDLGILNSSHGGIDNDVDAKNINLFNTLSLQEIENQVISNRLDQFNGDAEKAADSLELSRSAFYRRLSKSKE